MSPSQKKKIKEDWEDSPIVNASFENDYGNREIWDKNEEILDYFLKIIETHEQALREKIYKMSKLLGIARCTDLDCDNNGTITVMTSDGEIEPQQCQWCDERKHIINSVEVE